MAALFLLPSGGAAGDATSASSAGGKDCWNAGVVQIPRCHLFTNATVSVVGCGPASCDLDVRAGAYGLAGPLPGLVTVGSVTMIEGREEDRACLVPESAHDPTKGLYGCDRLCHQSSFGRSASCEGRRVHAVLLAPGECRSVVVASDLVYDPYNGFTAFAMFFAACRHDDGAPYVHALPL